MPPSRSFRFDNSKCYLA